SEAIASLDVSVLQDFLLAPVLEIRDVRTDKRVDFVGGARGTQELERLVDAGTAAVAFSLYPVSVQDLMAVADAGGIMPPRSTWSAARTSRPRCSRPGRCRSSSVQAPATTRSTCPPRPSVASTSRTVPARMRSRSPSSPVV